MIFETTVMTIVPLISWVWWRAGRDRGRKQAREEYRAAAKLHDGCPHCALLDELGRCAQQLADIHMIELQWQYKRESGLHVRRVSTDYKFVHSMLGRTQPAHDPLAVIQRLVVIGETLTPGDPPSYVNQ